MDFAVEGVGDIARADFEGFVKSVDKYASFTTKSDNSK